MKSLRISLILVSLLPVPAVHADTYCNSNGGKGVCCEIEMIEGEPELICIENGQTCKEKKAPKSCDSLRGTNDYCYCKTLQACNEACKVSMSSDWTYAGAAVKDLYDNCGSLVKKVAGADGFKDLNICYSTNKADYVKIQKNCGEFVKDYCGRVVYESK